MFICHPHHERPRHSHPLHPLRSSPYPCYTAAFPHHHLAHPTPCCAAAVRTMKSLLFYPIVTFVLLVGLMAYWIFVTAFLASIGGDIDQKSVLSSAEVRGGGGWAVVLWTSRLCRPPPLSGLLYLP
jgi:hypothetical protein